jgi:Baseplate J-like protein
VKTQIIQLNKNDDYISVRDKMSWSQTGRILLVWPREGHVLETRLELNLVKRHANTLGAQLALVSQSSEARLIAQEIGIPVFNSLRLAQDSHWRMGKPKNLDLQLIETHTRREYLGKLIHSQSISWLKHPTTRLICFGISVLALFILAIFILPSAKLELTPTTDTQSIILSITTDPSQKTINLSTGSLPVYTQEVVVEGRDSLKTTGTVIIPDQAAIAGLRFTNSSNQKIDIPVGTVVTTLGSDPIRYITSHNNSITVEPGESVTLSAHAILPGASGNLPANSLVAIEGDLGLELTVINPSATYGGSDAPVPAPNNQDLRVLRERLHENLAKAALAEIQSKLPSEDMIISPSVKIIETLEEKYTPGVGEPGKKLDLAMRLMFQIQVVSGEVLRSLVIPIMDANLSSRYTSIPDTLELKSLTTPTLGEDGKTQWSLQAQRKVQSVIAANQVVDKVKGLSIPLAIEILNDTFTLNGQTQITLKPRWWPRLPFLSMRIEVIQAETK